MPDRVDTLAGSYFLGRVLPDLDPKNQGRYRIHIPDLMPHIKESKGIFCHNYSSGNQMTKSQTGEYGSSKPLQPGTFVMVSFKENDPNTGFVDKIISRAEEGSDTRGQDSTDTISRPEDRDRRTVLWKSPNRSNVIYMNEETKEEPNTLYAVFNRDGNPGRATVFRVNEDGIHTFTRNNARIRILLNQNTQVDKDQSWYIMGNQKTNIDGEQDTTVASGRFITVNGNENHYVKSDFAIEIEGKAFITCHDKAEIWASKDIHIDSQEGFVNINNKCAHPIICQGTKPKTEVMDLGPSETTEYKSGLGQECHAVEKIGTENKGPKNLLDTTMNPEGKFA